MGFFFRKSIKMGPVRFNFSKSGIGVSAGVKGARISAGPRGAFVQVGAGGFYYRQRIDGGGRGQSSPRSFSDPQPAYIPSDHTAHRIETADVSQLIESSCQEVLARVNETAGKFPFAPLVAGAGLVCAWGSSSMIVLGITALAAWFVHTKDKVRRTTPLFYELDDESSQKFEAIARACQNLALTHRLWRIESKQHTDDWKRNAGAGSLITRSSATLSRKNPPFIATNVDVSELDLKNQKLYFLPDQVLVFQSGRYGAVSYESLRVEAEATRFIEDAGVPGDAQVVDHTWQYVRKDGGPDRRFSNNRQLPVALYGRIVLSSATGLNIHLHASNVGRAEEFQRAFSTAARQTLGQRPSQGNAGRSAGSTTSRNIDPSVLAVFGLDESASLNEITVAYRNLAKMYHPDKVAHLAPEFRELAEQRMKEINAAYDQAKRANATAV